MKCFFFLCTNKLYVSEHVLKILIDDILKGFLIFQSILEFRKFII
jgi:hypothetical protein